MDINSGMRTCTETRLERIPRRRRPARPHFCHRIARNLRRLPPRRTEARMRAKSSTATRTSSSTLFLSFSLSNFFLSFDLVFIRSLILERAFPLRPTDGRSRRTQTATEFLPSPFQLGEICSVSGRARAGQAHCVCHCVVEAKDDTAAAGRGRGTEKTRSANYSRELGRGKRGRQNCLHDV